MQTVNRCCIGFYCRLLLDVAESTNYNKINILFRKEVDNMAVVYATLIIKGKKTFADVPDRIKEQVKQVLIDLDCGDLAE